MNLHKIFILLIVILVFLSIPNEVLYPDVENRKNVLIITLDTTRADHLGCYNGKYLFTPNLDDLGKKGILFENCYSTVPLTLPSHSTIFTGKYPISINVRNNGRYFLEKKHKTLAELFKEKGYYTFAVISSYVLMSKFGLSQGFSFYDDSLDATNKITDYNSEISAGQVFNKFKLILDKAIGRKFFGWVHFYDPHIPYSPPGKYAEKFKNDPYLGEISYMDEYVGKIVSELKKRKLFKNTVIVIAGDHGEDKGEHKELGHGIFCYDVSLRVPLIIVNSGIIPGPRRITSRVSLIDIYPTLSEVFGFKIDSDVQGTNLIPGIKDPKLFTDQTIFFESLYGKEEMGWAPLTGVVDKEFKYISLPEPELYDLKKDPGEKNNIFNFNRKIAKKLDQELAGFYKRHSGNSVSSSRKLSDKDIKHLATLGYISSFKKSKYAIDPKVGIKYIEKLREVQSLVNSGNVNSAEKLLKRLFFSKNRIKTIHAYKMFDLIFRRKGDLKNLIKYQELALKDFPKNENIKILLAGSYFNSYRFSESEKLCNDILRKNPKNTQAIIQLGKIYLNEKKFDLSVRTFLKAASIEPKNIGIKKDLVILYLKSNNRQKAINILESIIGDDFILKNPDNVKLLVEISKLFLRAGYIRRSEKLLMDLTKYFGKSSFLFTSVGDFYFRSRKPGKAIEYFKKAIKTDEKFAPAYNGLGVLYLSQSRSGNDQNRLKEAYSMFDKAVQFNPMYANAYNGRGTANIFLGNNEKAVEDLEKALKLNPNLIDIYFNLGILYMRKSNYKRANELFNLCKKGFYKKLNVNQRARLDRLIDESNI